MTAVSAACPATAACALTTLASRKPPSCALPSHPADGGHLVRGRLAAAGLPAAAAHCGAGSRPRCGVREGCCSACFGLREWLYRSCLERGKLCTAAALQLRSPLHCLLLMAAAAAAVAGFQPGISIIRPAGGPSPAGTLMADLLRGTAAFQQFAQVRSQPPRGMLGAAGGSRSSSAATACHASLALCFELRQRHTVPPCTAGPASQHG